MTRLIPTLAITALAALAGGCSFNGSAEARNAGPTTDRNYQVGAFDRIVVAGPYDVTVATGRQPGVRAHGGQAILDETEIKVENGALIIGPRNKHGMRWNWGDDGKVTVAVSAAALHGATLAGSGNVRIDHVAGGDFKGEVAGSGDLAIDRIEAGTVALAIAGSGNINATGKANKLDASIAGSGDIDLSKLETVEASVSIVGSGNVRARATARADVTTMGSGDVEVTGGAKCSVSKHGSGDVSCS